METIKNKDSSSKVELFVPSQADLNKILGIRDSCEETSNTYGDCGECAAQGGTCSCDCASCASCISVRPELPSVAIRKQLSKM